MSYILDALRKADSDRERGVVPGIHTQAVPSVAGASSAQSSPVLTWAVVVLSALLVAVLAWQFVGREDRPPPASPVVAAAPPPPVASAAAPAPAALQAAPPAMPQATSPAAAPAPVRSAAAVPQSVPKASPSPAASSAPRVYAIADLPEPIRSQLPALTVGGAMYSQHPANRFLVINGQVFHEGEKLGPDLWLDQIRLKTAVLRFKDYRYVLPF